MTKKEEINCPENCIMRGDKCPIGIECPPILTRNLSNPLCQYYKSRQDIIREGITKILRQPIKIDLISGRKLKDIREGRNDRVSQILTYLHSQGIRLPDGSSLIKELDIP